MRNLARAYRSVAILGLNTLVLFVALNVVLGGVIWLRQHFFSSREPTLGPATAYPVKELASVYPGLSREGWEAMLRENWSRPVGYESYVLFRERPHRGNYVNVSDAGFRIGKAQGPWPPAPTNLNVFVFGGSTMFGYGVADEHTFSSYLQDALAQHTDLRVCVYNFGTQYYYSTQERILFERLLVQGHKPNLAIFVDGLNDFFHVDDVPMFNERVRAVFERENVDAQVVASLGRALPISRLARWLAGGRSSPQAPVPAPSIPEEAINAQATRVVERYCKNMALLESAAEAFGVVPLFVWQPVPCYKYDTRYHPFYPQEKRAHYRLHPAGYAQMRARLDRGELSRNFIWGADLQEKEQRSLYVDVHHYTAAFSREFASAVVRMAMARRLLRYDQQSILKRIP